MRYIDEVCPYCGSTFVEGDDIVVCPECATPHHRACWFAHGHCANEDKHGTDFVWTKTVQPEPETKEEAPPNSGDGKSLDIVCPDCGNVAPNGTLRCPKCGALLVPFASPGAPPVAQFRPEFNPNEDVGGLKSGDIVLSSRTGGAGYIKRFRKLANGAKLTWNWGAFLFSPFWFFYRKLYKTGAIFLAIFTALMLLTAPFTAVLDTITAELQQVYDDAFGTVNGEDAADESASGDKQNSVYDEAAQQKYISEYTATVKSHIPQLVPLIVIYGALLLLKIICALFADKIYFKKISRDVTEIRSHGDDERTVQTELFRAGGASMLIGLASYFGYEMILMLFDYINK